MSKTFSSSSTTTGEENLEKQVVERVFLVKNSLLSSHYQNRWSIVGIKQIINRFFLLLQRRCVIVVLEKVENTGYKIVHHTCFDPFWKNDFESYLVKKQYKNLLLDDSEEHDFKNLIIIDQNKLSNPRINKNGFVIENYCIQFYPNRYFMIHEMKSNKDLDLKVQNEERNFPLVHIKQDGFLSRLAAEFEESMVSNERMGKFFRRENIDGRVLNKEKEWSEHKIIRSLPYDLKQDWSDIPSDFFENHFQKLREIFNVEYQKMSGSPLLSGRYCPNIIFSIRNFSQDSFRFCEKRHNKKGAYAHNIRMLIPDKQKEDFKYAFSKLKEKYSAYIDSPGFKGAEEQNIDDLFFWKLLKKPGGIDEILEILEAPFESYIRSMADAVFESGNVNIKEGPFTFGATNRLEEKELEKKSESPGYRRSVCFHYLLLILCGKVDNLFKIKKKEEKEKLYVFLNPGYVGGTPLFCTGFVFTQKDEEEHKCWLDNYHFYHSFSHYLVRGIRSRIRDLYLEEIKGVYLSMQNYIVEGIINKKRFEPEEVCNVLNKKFRILSRVYPFVFLEFGVIRSEKHHMYLENIKEWHPCFLLHYMKSRAYFIVRIRENSFFPCLLEGASFLSKHQLQESILEADERMREEVLYRI